jgi:hypothetical protein
MHFLTLSVLTACVNRCTTLLRIGSNTRRILMLEKAGAFTRATVRRANDCFFFFSRLAIV